MGRGTGKCSHSCPIQQWDLSSEKPGLSMGGRKASLDGEGVGDTKKELQSVDALTRRAIPVGVILNHPSSAWVLALLHPSSG